MGTLKITVFQSIYNELNSARTDVVEAGTGNALGGYGVPGVAGGGGDNPNPLNGQTQYHVKAPYYAGNGVFLLLCEEKLEIKLNGNKKDKRWLC